MIFIKMMCNIKFHIICLLFNLWQLIFASKDKSTITKHYATDGEFPWHASVLSIYYYELKKLCSGSIISHQWILTAAQCVFLENTALKNLKIGLGSTNFISPQTVFNYSFFNGNYNGKIVIHPDYNQPMKMNDVALIRLQVNFSKNIQAVTLPSIQQSHKTYLGKSAKISGFLSIYANNIIGYRLEWVRLRIIDNCLCSDYFSERKITPASLCAIGTVKQNLCDADVGGALVIYDKSSGRHVQVGIRSFISSNMCDIGGSGYMRITSFLDWINETIN